MSLRGHCRKGHVVTEAARTLRGMQGGRYHVAVLFEMTRPETEPPLGSTVRRIESLLPEGATVRLIGRRGDSRDAPGEIEVSIRSAGPAMALRDVARAIELAADQEQKVLGHLVRATVEQLPDQEGSGTSVPES